MIDPRYLCLLGLVSFGLALSCGEEGAPRPGHSDPCQGAAAGVLGCPPMAGPTSTSAATQATIADACQRLVACGLLASQWFGGYSGKSCRNDGDCGAGRCLKPDGQDSRRCYPHLMDYAWCVDRLSNPPSDPCGSGGFTQRDVTLALQCITRAQCPALGLPFDQKRASRSKRAGLDKFGCKDGKTIVWTISTCDHGLLFYDH